MRSDLMKNRILYRCLETNRYLCTIIQNKMGINKLKVVLTEEAQAFLDAQPFKAQQKIYYNIFKVEEGVMKVDIFKKLENTEIWEFRTLYNGICYRLFSFWDTEEETLVIATHGIVKKTQKTPLKEIAKAEEIKKSTLIIKINSIMAQMKLIPADNMKDKLWGKRGTPEREAMETKLKEDVNAYIVGEAIRKARLAQNLTQEQLGERIGVQRAQISKLEKGTSVITLPTMSRVFQALGIATATLDLGIAGKIALW